MSVSMIIVAVVVFLATQFYMKKRCEAEKRKLAHDMIVRLALIEDESLPQDTSHHAYREVMGNLKEAEGRAYLTAENLYFNSLSAAAYYRLRDQIELNGKYDKLFSAIKAGMVAPEQRERYLALREKYLGEGNNDV
jgi:hypothetical protein